MQHKKILLLTQFSLLVAIEAVIAFTPLGSLPAIGPIVATLGHIPVIIAAITLGTWMGALMGAFFGLFSFLVWTFMPPSPIAFVFTPFYSLGDFHGNIWSLFICFLPRILVGVVTGLSFHGLQKLTHRPFPVYFISGLLGSLTNTFLVLLGIYLCFGHPYAQAIGSSYSLLLGVLGLSVLTNGIPEAILGGASSYFIAKPLKRILKQ